MNERYGQSRNSKILLVLVHLLKVVLKFIVSMNVLFPFQQKNWFESFLDCRNKGLDLASVENEEENQALLKLLIPIGEFLTDLIDSLPL